MSDEFYTWTKGSVENLGAFFKTNEFECSCGDPGCVEQKIAIDLITKLSQMRASLGSFIMIHSGYRCAIKQAQLRAKGYETAVGISQHELGNAADIAASDMHGLLQLAKDQFKAVGVAHSFLHVDLRDDKVRYWSYSSS